MKLIFNISLVLNAILLGGLVYSQVGHRPAASHFLAPGLAVVPAQSEPAPPPALEISPRAETPKFCWSQLQSTNYHVYVQNLRQAGCPEPSVRAIVTADVRAIFDKWRREMELTLTEIEAKPLAVRLAAYNKQHEIQGRLEQLPAQEARMIADLLGDRAAAPIATGSKLPPASAAVTARDPVESDALPPVMPVVLQPVDPAALELDASQAEAINKLRQVFLQKIGGTNQNPDDPAYLERWQKAQPEIDELMRGTLGDADYQSYQIQASMAANGKAAGPP